VTATGPADAYYTTQEMGEGWPASRGISIEKTRAALAHACRAQAEKDGVDTSHGPILETWEQFTMASTDGGTQRPWRLTMVWGRP
jgi:hypothetical protein